MSTHFIFVPGEWHGEGTIRFSYSPELLHYSTVWVVVESESGIIRCEQRVEKGETGGELLNLFHFDAAGSVLLQSEALGEVLGSFKVEQDGEVLTWSFTNQGPTGFTGVETYVRQSESEYLVYARYGTEELHTMIEGHLWKA